MGITDLKAPYTGCVVMLSGDRPVFILVVARSRLKRTAIDDLARRASGGDYEDYAEPVCYFIFRTGDDGLQ